MTTLECLSHELLLCIWDNLSKADAIFSFSQLNQRFTSLLIRYCDHHHKLDLFDSSLATCRFLYRDVATSSEWRSNLTVLLVGNPYNYGQLDLLASAVMAAIQSQPCDIDSGVFPRLISFRVDQWQCISDEVRDTLLYRVANASTLRTMNWVAYRQQSHHALSLFNWLFLHSPKIHLTECLLQSPFGGHRFELTYCQAIAAGYSPHHSLVYLAVDVHDWSTLLLLLHYLPRLEKLDVQMEELIATDGSSDVLSTTLDYPKQIRSLTLRYLNVFSYGWNRVEKLILRLGDLMENLTLTMYYSSVDAPYFLLNADPFSEMCQKLHRLRSVHFNISLKLFIPPTWNNLAGFTRSFRTDYWLDGSLGRVCVGVNYHRIRNTVEIDSLPYNFPDIALKRTVDFIDMQFNTQDEERACPSDATRLLESSLVGFARLSVCFSDKESVPLAFLRALQSAHGKNKTLALYTNRGILPDDARDHIQLTQFRQLELVGTMNCATNYEIEELLAWLKLLPNLKVLYVDLLEVNHWMNDESIHFFLDRLKVVYVTCSSIDEDMMDKLLSYFVDSGRFSRLLRLSLIHCPNLSLPWNSVRRWIDRIFDQSHKHPLMFLEIDFLDDEYIVQGLALDYAMSTVDLCVRPGNLSFWVKSCSM